MCYSRVAAFIAFIEDPAICLAPGNQFLDSTMVATARHPVLIDW
jgi:hypothetical protein